MHGARTTGTAAVDRDRLVRTFLDLVAIDSPSGHEERIGAELERRFAAAGTSVRRDQAGNLVATLRGTGDGAFLVSTHMDTVGSDVGIRPVIGDDGVIRTDGSTILGADDKAAVTVLVELAARHATAPPPIGIELVFTVAEEDGLRGAAELDLSAVRAPFGYALDHASPIGELITAAPTHQSLVAEFEGATAHAGIRPEEGRSAIEAAARIAASVVDSSPRPVWIPRWRSRMIQASAVCSRSNSLTCSSPCRAVVFQWIRFIASPGAYGRTEVARGVVCRVRIGVTWLPSTAAAGRRQRGSGSSLG